jgi:hypothetical protein
MTLRRHPAPLVCRVTSAQWSDEYLVMRKPIRSNNEFYVANRICRKTMNERSVQAVSPDAEKLSVY